jgi:hypothetical protein
MSLPNDQTSSAWFRLRSWIIGITAVLVVMPAMINAGIDVYRALLDIPRTDAERTNAKLFKKYFNKPPVTSFPVPIKNASGTVAAKFSIYEEGDIFIEFGNSSQWFPFPKEKSGQVSAFSIIKPALADDQAPLRGIGRYQQNDQMDKNTIIRQRTYENGVQETQRIDTRTGKISDQKSRPLMPSTQDNLSPYGVIDLEAQRNSPPNIDNPATLCLSQLGTCKITVPIQKGAQCYCYTASGTIPGMAQ